MKKWGNKLKLESQNIKSNIVKNFKTQITIKNTQNSKTFKIACKEASNEKNSEN